jgi:hypothetical protein
MPQSAAGGAEKVNNAPASDLRARLSAADPGHLRVPQGIPWWRVSGATRPGGRSPRHTNPRKPVSRLRELLR